MSRDVSPLDPRAWPADEVEELLALSSSLRGEPASAVFDRACVVASTGPLGSYAGRKALEAGGTAVDAALATAFTQIASAAGCWVSYAGIFAMVHFEAATGEVTSLDGGFRTFVDETDPATIPAAPEPSGRTALVPGFFAGAWAAHQRFGALPWADLLLPAIWIADGVPLGESLAGMLAMREPVISRTPEGRAALMPDGRLPQVGEHFVQEELARTLRLVAEHGAAYLYTGAWAARFVEVVRREGGKATIGDLSSYQPVWAEPLVGSAFGFDVHSVGLPNTGGAALIEGLKVTERLAVGDPQTDPLSLHQLVQVARSNHALSGLAPAERISEEHASRVAKVIQETGLAVLPSSFLPGSHSDFVTAADEAGNMVAVCHSINTAAYGTTGIFVDGISIPDAASFQQPALAEVTPGDPLPHPTNPAIVLKDGKAVLASSSIGAGLLETTLTCVHRHLALGLGVESVVQEVLVHGPELGVAVSDSINNDIAEEMEEQGGPLTKDLTTLIGDLHKQAEDVGGDPRDSWALLTARFPQAVTGDLSAEFVAAVAGAGTKVVVKPEEEAAFMRGYWGGISRDPATGELRGARTGFVNSRVEGL